MTIVDAYDESRGRMDRRVWGVIPFMRAGGGDIETGQVSRYMAELPWTPYSIVANADLEWREAGEMSVQVATAAQASHVEVRLDFNRDGDIVGSSMPGRPRQVGNASVETPWRGEFADYTTFGGIRIPRRGEVRWELPGGPFTYWEGRMIRVEVA